MTEERNQSAPMIQWGMRLNYPPIQEGLAIPVSDWDGLIQRIRNIQPDLRRLPVAYSIFFGIGVTSGLSIAPLLISSLPLWVIMLYVAICAAALALGAGLLIADRVLSKQRSIQIDQLVNEMSYIKDRYLENRTLVD
jgi:hypothetical protein